MTGAPNPDEEARPADPNAPASFRVEEMHGLAVVVASGEVDMTTAPGLREALGAASQLSARVVLDLTSVTFMDSSGIGVLLDALRAGTGGHASPLCLAGAQPRVRRVLDITRISRMLPTYETLAEALDQPT